MPCASITSARRACSPRSCGRSASCRPSQIRAAGQAINSAKESLTAALDARREALESERVAAALTKSGVDVTLPGRGERAGQLHPVTRTLRRMVAIFEHAGFDVAHGPRGRGRVLQLHRAEHPRGPSRARDARHVLSELRAPAAHAHVAGADPRAQGERRADPVDRAGPRLPARLGPHALRRCSTKSKASSWIAT